MSLDFDTARLPNACLRPEHDQWRAQLRRFFDREVIPYAAQWDEDGHIPKDSHGTGTRRSTATAPSVSTAVPRRRIL